MVTVIWGRGLSEDGRETFDSVASVAQARVMLEREAVHDNGSWIAVER